VALSISAALKSNNIKVIVDEESMHGGEKIEDFMAQIEDVDFFMPLISESSVLKPYVVIEINTAIKLKKAMLPCLLDNALFEDDLDERKRDQMNQALTRLGSEIKDNIDGNIKHLLTEHARWVEFRDSFSDVVDELKKINLRTIDIDKLEESIKPFIQDIQKLKRNGKSR
jgi:hypothetical protein